MSIKQRIDAQTDALSALLTYANDATGKGDADIGEAIRTLVDGFGKGGGGGDNPKVFVKDFTPTGGGDYARTYPIQHNLGTTDVTVIAWLMDTNGVKAAPTASYHMLGYFYSEMADIGTYQLDNGANVPVGKTAVLVRKSYSATATAPSVTYSSQPYFAAKDENSVDLFASNGNWRRGWTYRIIVIDNSILTNSSAGNVIFEEEYTPIVGEYEIEMPYASDDITLYDKNFIAVLSCDNNDSVVASWAHRANEEFSYSLMSADYIAYGATNVAIEPWDDDKILDIWEMGMDSGTFKAGYTYRIKVIAY